MLIVTLLATALLLAIVLVCTARTERRLTEQSFEELAVSTRLLAQDYRDTIYTDQTILEAMAALIAEYGTEDTDTLLRVMDSYGLEKSFISHLELLLPNGWLLHKDGRWFDASDRVDFQAEAARGICISGRVESFWDPGELVLYHAVPVERDGRAIAILYGIVSLEPLSHTFEVDAYGGAAFVMVSDGDSGDILLDTWHNTLGNMSEMGGRKMLGGYTHEQTQKNMREGLPGEMRFVSRSTGDILHLHYEPMGVNNWSVTLGVSEEVALSDMRPYVTSLYQMTMLVGLVLLLYMAYVVWYLLSDRRSIYRESITDQCTGLKNRSAYEKHLRETAAHRFDSAACVYVDANGLHEVNNAQGHAAGDRLLRTVAQCLRARFPETEVYRIGGDEFVVFPVGLDEAECRRRMSGAMEALAGEGYSISYGVACGTDEIGLSGLVHEADSAMLGSKRAYYASHDRRTPR